MISYDIDLYANNYRIQFDLYCMYFYIHSIWMILNSSQFRTPI